jgi:cobalt-zinc-cadmium efflux system outer membrane protein
LQLTTLAAGNTSPGDSIPRKGRAWVRRLAFAFLAALPAVAQAEIPRSGAPELPTDPTLQKLIDQSLAVRPELAQAGAAASAERDRVSQVGALPDPMLQLGVQNNGFTSWQIGTDPMSFYSTMASQTFPWPGKLRLRSTVAALAADQADESVARLRLSTEADVRRAYLRLMLARDRLALLDRLEAIFRRVAVVARARYESGLGVQSDILRAQLEIKRVWPRRWALQAEADTASQALNRLRGHPLDQRIVPPVHVEDLTLPTLRAASVACEDALARSPELASARAGLTQGQRSVELARKGYFPDFTVNLGVMPRGGSLAPMWLATVGIPIPIWAGTKQNRAVAQSESRLAARQRNAQAVEQVLRLRVQQRRTALAAALETIRLYREGLLAESEATAESTLAQYEVGKVTFISVLEADAGFIADQDGFLRALAQAQSIEIDDAEVSLGPVGLPESGAGAGADTGDETMGTGSMRSDGAASAPARNTGGSSSGPEM